MEKNKSLKEIVIKIEGEKWQNASKGFSKSFDFSNFPQFLAKKV